MSISKIKSWFFLFRPWSYTATLVPFMLSAGMFAVWDVEENRWGAWVLGLLAGVFLQATVNLLNTWGDEISGVDDVPGAIRTTPQVHEGTVSLRSVLVVAIVMAVSGAVAGLAACVYPASRTCEKIVLGNGLYLNSAALFAGFIGMLGATNYSTGIKFKYRGLGVPFVSVLMGPLEMIAAVALIKPVAASAVFWNFADAFTVQGLKLAALFLFAVLPVASLVGVIMHGNDMRDIPSDRAAGIVTLASRLGPRGALYYYFAAHIVPYVICAVLMIEFAGSAGCGAFVCPWVVFLLPFLCLPLTIKTLRVAGNVYMSNPSSPSWRGLERASGKIHFLFGIFYSSAWVFFTILLARAHGIG